MRRAAGLGALGLIASVALGCVDAGGDGGVDGGGIVDAGRDGGRPPDAGPDGGLDAGGIVDAGPDGGLDGGGIVDAGPDGGRPPDAGCTDLFTEDFEDGVLSPWTAVAGDVTISGGRLRVVRTGSRWGEAEVTLGSTLDGAWELEVEMEMLTSQSLVALCVQAPGATVHYYCLTLNNKTENGSTRGAHLFEDNLHDNIGSLPSSELIEYAFDPGVASPHTLRLTHSAVGLMELFVDGTSRGTATDATLTTFDRLHVYGMQDTSGGHGGFLDDVVLCSL